MSRFGDPKTEHQVKRAKQVNYFALLVLVSLLATSFYFFLELQNKKAELLEKTKMLADTTDNLRRIRAELEAIQMGLEVREETTMGVLDSVRQLVENHDYSEASVVATNFKEKDRRPWNSACLYTFGIPETLRQEAARYLKDEQVNLVLDTTLRKSETWLKNNSTVIYYSDKSKFTASRIAAGLNLIIGARVDTLRGPESEVPKYNRGAYFNIHLVNSQKVIEQKQIQSQIFQNQVLK